MLKRNQFANSQTSLEPKVMLAAPAAPNAEPEPETIQLGADVGAGLQTITNISKDAQVETGVIIDENGAVDEDSFSVGDANSIDFERDSEPGETSAHTHSTPDFILQEDEFVDTNGKGPDGKRRPFPISSGPSPADALNTNLSGEKIGLVASGPLVSGHEPSEEGLRAVQTDIIGQGTPEAQDAAYNAKEAELAVTRQQAIDVGEQRALTVADRTAGPGNGQLTQDQVQKIHDNADAKVSQKVGGRSFKGNNDGSGTLVENKVDPSIS